MLRRMLGFAALCTNLRPRQPIFRMTGQPALKPPSTTQPALAPLLLSLIPLMAVAAINLLL